MLQTQLIYCGDNLQKLRELPDESVDLIYIDPPFNSNRNYEVFWGDTQEKRAFDDRFGTVQVYIEWMRPRVSELYRVLKKTGSFYYHCDWHASHYIKVMLDQRFGINQFRNEIVWCYTGPGSPGQRQFSRKHDAILWYSKGNTWTFNGDDVRLPHSPKTKENYKVGLVGSGFVGADHVIHQKGKIPEDWWQIAIAPRGKEYLGYPTQKPQALLDRIIRAASNKGDVILDGFCGCGTTLYVAQVLGRRWIGIDISPTACRVMARRLAKECALVEGTDFWVRDLPKTAEELRQYPPFEFENWAVNALNTVLVNGHAIANKARVGDMGIDGRIYPVSVVKEQKAGYDLFGASDRWVPVQVKQKDKASRPDIDSFQTAMRRQGREKGFFISFDFTSDAEKEIDRVFRAEALEIIPVRVSEILAEQRMYRV